MKILFFNSLYKQGGGAEITLYNLTKGLCKRGYDIVFVSLGREYERFVEEGMQIIKIPIKNFYLPNIKASQKPNRLKMYGWHFVDTYNPFMKKEIKKILDDEMPDLVSIHNIQGFSPIVWDVVYESGVPFAQVLHDQYILCPKNMFKEGDVCKQRCLECQLLRMPHKRKSHFIENVVGISRFILDKYLAYGYFQNVKKKEVIYNSRDFGQNIYKNERKNLGDKIVLGFIGTLSPYKGIEKFLDIVKNNIAKNIEILVAGRGELGYEKHLKQKFSSLNNVHFIGYTAQEEFFPKIDILVVPSIVEEALGMTAVEAFLYGKPVFVHKRGALEELVDENNGVLFTFDNLLKKLEAMISNIDFYKKNEKNIRAKAMEKFSYDSWIDKWEKLYKEIVK